MGRFLLVHLLFLLINLSAILTSLACPYCPNPTPKHPTLPPKSKPPPRSKPPKSPPKHKPPPSVKSPLPPKPPSVSPPKPPPMVLPPAVPTPPPVVTPPVVPEPPTVKPLPCPPPPSKPPPPQTCPIDALKLGACVDLLGGLVHIGIGSSSKDTCCPLLEGLVDLDAALCLCTTIKAKLLDINLIIPIALELLIDCGKNPPPGFKCPA